MYIYTYIHHKCVIIYIYIFMITMYIYIYINYIYIYMIHMAMPRVYRILHCVPTPWHAIPTNLHCQNKVDLSLLANLMGHLNTKSMRSGGIPFCIPFFIQVKLNQPIFHTPQLVPLVAEGLPTAPSMASMPRVPTMPGVPMPTAPTMPAMPGVRFLSLGYDGVVTIYTSSNLFKFGNLCVHRMVEWTKQHERS